MLRISIKSDIGRAIDHLSRMPEDLSRGIIAAVRGEAIRLQGHIVRDYLSGQALHRRSGRLSRSIHTGLNEEFFWEGGRVVGMATTVGTNVEYAAYHEFGFQGTEQVRAHVRRIKSRNQYVKETFIDRTKWRSGRMVTRKRLVSTGVTYVRAHSRTVNYAGHPFMRPALEDLKGTMRENIRAAIEKALGGGE